MVRTMRGQQLDMARLVTENAEVIALGNASMNARGDLIGSRGVVIKTQEQIARDYHAKNPKAVKQVALRDIQHEVFISPAEALSSHKEEAEKVRKRKIAE